MSVAKSTGMLTLGVMAMLTLAPTIAMAQTIPPVADMRAKVDAFVRKSYPVAAGDRRIHVEYADINSDGIPEAFVILTDAKACGADPCALVLDVSEDSASEIAVLAGTELRALQTKSGKWRDIMLDGKRLRWQDAGYR